MNQTQKNYAISRVHGILLAKLNLVSTQLVKEETAYKEATKLTNIDMFHSIKNGDAFINDKNQVDYSVTKERMAKAAKLTPLAMTEMKNTYLYFNDPFSKKGASKIGNWYGSVPTMLNNLVKKARAHLRETSDKIMLGSNEEALAAIQAAENIELK